MNPQKILKKQVERYIIDNSHNSKEVIYSKVFEEFGIDRKTISRYYLNLENAGILDGFNKLPEAKYTENQVKKVLSQDQSGLSVSMTTDIEVKSLEDLLNLCEVNSDEWEVISWKCKKWSVSIKNANNELEVKDLYSVAANFKPVILEKDLGLQKDVLLKELFKASPESPVINTKYSKSDEKVNLLELALFDMHFGKLAHKEESGEDYDLKIAANRYNDALNSLLDRINITSIERILFPIGNDLINIDNIFGTTTLGTKQDSDSRFYKIVRTVKELLIRTINRLSTIAPVDVVVCSGNHDQQTAFMIGEMIQAYYNNVPAVTVDNGYAQRKYYRFGKASFLFTHGNNEKHSSLGMIFAAEKPELWAATTQRYIQIGHFHHNKKIDYISNEEFQGFQIQIIPSLSGPDSWHVGKGFLSLKQAKAFLFNRNEGLIGEFTYTAK